jgi:hypothetical protein
VASHYLRKYATATTIDFELYKLDGTGLKVDAASATHDIKIMKDEGAEADTTADAFVDEGQGYSLALTATEMTAARVVIYIVDLSAPQVWLDKVLIIETYAHASAQHADGAVDAKIGTITNTGGTATIGAALGDVANSTVATRLTNAQTDLNKIGTITNTGGTATLGAALGDVANSTVAVRLTNAQTELNKVGTISNAGGTATIGAVLGAFANVDLVTRVADIHTDVGTALTNIATLDTVIDNIHDTDLPAVKTDTGAIKAITDLLTLAAIADAVHDETLTAHTTADSAGLALKNLLKISKNKWGISGTTLTFYDDNGSSALYSFTLDDASAPTSRTPS